eukprot:TRINITY_DN269_c0_g2_i1.p1 TRINITY_DN269_c0_g2~~TRINITY_DN269_c0_g2_i1.p1  ORF type:complete len:137 (-),score=24.55 TRINITY_DN269_c0_g2_i1:33-443(-)
MHIKKSRKKRILKVVCGVDEFFSENLPELILFFATTLILFDQEPLEYSYDFELKPPNFTLACPFEQTPFGPHSTCFTTFLNDSRHYMLPSKCDRPLQTYVLYDLELTGTDTNNTIGVNGTMSGNDNIDVVDTTGTY